MSATVSFSVSGGGSVELEYDNAEGEAVKQLVNTGQTFNVNLADGDATGVHVSLVP